MVYIYIYVVHYVHISKTSYKSISMPLYKISLYIKGNNSNVKYLSLTCYITNHYYHPVLPFPFRQNHQHTYQVLLLVLKDTHVY